MFTVAALYKFTPFADPAALRAPLLAVCEAAGLRGALHLGADGAADQRARKAKSLSNRAGATRDQS